MDPSHTPSSHSADSLHSADRPWYPSYENRGRARGRARAGGRGRARVRSGVEAGCRGGGRGRYRGQSLDPASFPNTLPSDSYSPNNELEHQPTPTPSDQYARPSETSAYSPHFSSAQPPAIHTSPHSHVNRHSAPFYNSRPACPPGISRYHPYPRSSPRRPYNRHPSNPPSHRHDNNGHGRNHPARWRGQPTTSYHSRSTPGTAHPIAAVTPAPLSQSKTSLSNVPSSETTSLIQTTVSDWSAKVWQGVGFTSSNECTSAQFKPGIEQTPSIKLGLGRATGLSRVPDKTLLNNPSLIQQRLDDLVTRFDRLERSNCSVVGSCMDVTKDAAISGETATIFEAILAEFRELTMAITASTQPEVHCLAIPVYEAAADAALLGGNLDFYLVCQTRLLRDLYNEHILEEKGQGQGLSLTRMNEFVGYSLLYFGVFVHSSIELAKKFREMSRQTAASSQVQYALSAIIAYQTQDPIRFIALYKKGNVRQRTILHPTMKHVQKLALNAIIKSYLQLERTYAASLLGMASESEVLHLLEICRPDLLPPNSQPANNFIFRLPRNGAK